MVAQPVNVGIIWIKIAPAADSRKGVYVTKGENV